MKIIATQDKIKIVEMQDKPMARPNPMAEVVEELLQISKPLFTKDAAIIEFNKKGQNRDE